MYSQWIKPGADFERRARGIFFSEAMTRSDGRRPIAVITAQPKVMHTGLRLALADLHNFLSALQSSVLPNAYEEEILKYMQGNKYIDLISSESRTEAECAYQNLLVQLGLSAEGMLSSIWWQVWEATPLQNELSDGALRHILLQREK